MRSQFRLRVSAAAAGKVLAVTSLAALVSGCGLSNSNYLWDDPQATGSVVQGPAPAADPIITGTNQPYTPYSRPQPARPAAPGRVVFVQPGDTAYSIAKRNGTTVQALAYQNNLRAPYNISVGQRLTVPGAAARADYTQTGSIAPARQPAPAYRAPARPAQVVTGGAGDTLYSIGRRYGVHVNELARLNRIPPPYNIQLGQRIQVPSHAGIARRAQQAPRLAPPVQRAPARQVTASAPGRAGSSPNKDYIYYFHKVKPGETLPVIAKQYRIEPSTLATFNQLPAHAALRTGQVIRVPM